MEHPVDRSAEVVPATLEHEIELIRDAIAMVAAGASPRVVVANIRFGETLLDLARSLALQAGVRLVPLWRTDESGADISVERIDE